MLPLAAILLLSQTPDTGISKANPAQAPEAVVQRYVEGYNAHNVEALLSTLDLDVKLYLFPDKVQVQGKLEISNVMKGSFSGAPGLKLEVTERMVAGTRVIDHLWIKGRPDGRVIRGLQIYEVRNGLITGIWFAVD
jgi:hypothetical protein